MADTSIEISQLNGLNDEQVAVRKEQARSNNVTIQSSRSYRAIIRSNLFNSVNLILFSIGLVLISIGRWGDAITSTGLIVMNVTIGMFQEIRTKQKLDNIVLLTRPKVTVRREGEDRVLDPSELVEDDIILAQSGDQIVVDGVVLGDGQVEMDESLLTGESDLVPKAEGDLLYSGSICVNGRAYFRATKVGNESFANELTADARQFRVLLTPLQKQINFILRLLILLAAFIGFLYFLSTLIAGLSLMRRVQIAAVVTGLVPSGLFLMVILSYAMGSLRMATRGVLVQSQNAVESLSNVTLLCTDKTGTLTTNQLQYDGVQTTAHFPDADEFKRVLGDFARSLSSSNKTADALKTALPGKVRFLVEEVPFSSARKWSAMVSRDPERTGTYVLGAPEILAQQASMPSKIETYIAEQTTKGRRVLVMAHTDDTATIKFSANDYRLPALDIIGAVCLSDELRPGIRETLDNFDALGIETKIISGDNPATVAALAQQAGFHGELATLSGLELDGLSEPDLREKLLTTRIFGRIRPDQKERLVSLLQAEGHYVAMIGDGVNDVLSLKTANVGIAMESGSSAARSVADMILLGDSFDALPMGFSEGQRILNGMRSIMKLYITRVLYAALVIIANGVIGAGFPYLPKHNALVAGFAVGFPAFMLGLLARPGQPKRPESYLREVADFVFPAAIVTFFFALLVYLVTFGVALRGLQTFPVTPELIASFEDYAGLDYSLTTDTQYRVEVSHLAGQTALTTFGMLAGVGLLLFVEPPTRWFAVASERSETIIPVFLIFGILIAYGGVFYIDWTRSFFELVDFTWEINLVIALVSLVWLVTLRMVFYYDAFKRFLRVEFDASTPKHKATEA